MVGGVGRKIILVDDIVDTGSTLVSACKELQKHGVKEITAIATHGLFTGNDWGRIFRLGVKTLYVTDSCPEAMRKRPNVQVISLAPLLPLVVHRIARKELQYEYAIA